MGELSGSYLCDLRMVRILSRQSRIPVRTSACVPLDVAPPNECTELNCRYIGRRPVSIGDLAQHLVTALRQTICSTVSKQLSLEKLQLIPRCEQPRMELHVESGRCVRFFPAASHQIVFALVERVESGFAIAVVNHDVPETAVASVYDRGRRILDR